MATEVRYWAIGTAAPSTLRINTADISGHLLADWLPSVPSSQSRAFMGWPDHILEPVYMGASQHLSLHERTAKTERQWKGFISWMLGIAGTRQVLKGLKYRWIAPCSAFYPEIATAVATPHWHRSFPRSRLSISRSSRTDSRLRPDYIVIRKVRRAGAEWAVVESKGTSRPLSGLTVCPASWRAQVTNVQVVLDGAVLRIPRHIVVATRVNPNATRSATRCLQIRAWNSEQPTGDQQLMSSEAAVDVASAYLFGLFENLNLPATARALATSVLDRRTASASPLEPLAALRDQSASELQQRLRSVPENGDGVHRFEVSVESDLETVVVELDPATVALTHALIAAREPQAAAEALVKTDEVLDSRAPRAIRNDAVPEVEIPAGITIRFPMRRAARLR